MDLDAAGPAVGPAQGHEGLGAGGQGGQCRGTGVGLRVDAPDLAVVEFGQDGLGGELEVENEQGRNMPGRLSRVPRSPRHAVPSSVDLIGRHPATLRMPKSGLVKKAQRFTRKRIFA